MKTPEELKEHEQSRVDAINATYSATEEVYYCDKCLNKGYIAKLRENADGSYSHSVTHCTCVSTRKAIKRMERSGLKNVMTDSLFDKYEASEEWQKSIKNAAMEYAADPHGWFFIGGQSGAGKTHLCTAISRELILSGKNFAYMLWRDDAGAIKRSVTDPDEYSKLVSEYKRVDVLYIDDLFKTGKDANGRVQRPTAADVTAAFEIINYRYLNPELITIISSEFSTTDLIKIDEATASRIIEKAGDFAFDVKKDRSRNYRLKNVKTV